MSGDAMPKVVIVEDDERLARVLERALRGHAEVLRAKSVGDARRFVEEEAPLAVVTDITLPDGSGFDVIKHLRSTDATTPALVMSGNEAFVNKATDVDVKFLHKPFEPRQVVDFVRRAHADRKTLVGAIAAVLEEWRLRYKLTRAEKALLAAATAQGSRKDLTRTLGKSEETIKTHTRNVLAKTKHDKLSIAALELVREALARATSSKS